MKAFFIIVLIVAAVLFGLRYSADHSRKSANEYFQEAEATRNHYENQKEAAKEFWKERDKSERQSK